MEYEIRVCKEGDPDYPDAFKELSGMPRIFYYQGDLCLLNSGKNAALIGSRSCSETALQFAFQAGAAAAEEDVHVINGLALGCDTEALRGALQHGGKCIAILPGGLENIYPKVNKSLAEDILKHGGLLISEYEKGEAPKKYTFVERDRLQSALAQGILVISADTGSGTMHTVNAAIRQRKRLASYSSRITKAAGNREIEAKPGTKEVSDIKDLKAFFQELPNVKENRQMTLFDYCDESCERR